MNIVWLFSRELTLTSVSLKNRKAKDKDKGILLDFSSLSGELCQCFNHYGSIATVPGMYWGHHPGMTHL